MKIISLTMIGNEQEIVESFVRYNANIVDEFVFVSSCCVDNTLIILKEMRREGFNIRVFIEEDISFDQRYLDNKYLKMLAKEDDSDIIIPLDCDEFITGTHNPRSIIEGLDLDSVYTVFWKNYSMTRDDDVNEPFIPRRCVYYKDDFVGNTVGKVIIPTNLVIKNGISLETGHHEAIGKHYINKVIEDLWLAHYPTVSESQYLLRIYESSIKYITWTKRSFDEGYHIYNQIKQIESGEDIYGVATGYGQAASDVTLKRQPLNLEFYNKPFDMKYQSLAKIDVFKGVQRIGQLMALRSYILERISYEMPEKKSVLVYGTGVGAGRLLNGIPENLVNIRAYIDADPSKRFRMFNHRLVIPPDYTRFFKYDYIIISSPKYYDEMETILLELGVEYRKIKGPDCLFDLIDGD